jgi:hypothetical protein
MLRRNGNEAGACKYQRKYKQREHAPPLAMHTKGAKMSLPPRHSLLCNAQTENRGLRRINAEQAGRSKPDRIHGKCAAILVRLHADFAACFRPIGLELRRPPQAGLQG